MSVLADLVVAMTIPLTWVRAVRGHELALDGMTLRCRKTGGQLLASVPRAVRSSRVGEQFAALLEHLDGHEKECRATVESSGRSEAVRTRSLPPRSPFEIALRAACPAGPRTEGIPPIYRVLLAFLPVQHLSRGPEMRKIWTLAGIVATAAIVASTGAAPATAAPAAALATSSAAPTDASNVKSKAYSYRSGLGTLQMRYGKYKNKTWIWARIEKPTKLANDKYEITVAAQGMYLHKNISGTSYTTALEAKDGVKYKVCIAKIDAQLCTGPELAWVY